MIVTNLPNCYMLLRRLWNAHDFGSILSHVTFRRKSSQLSEGTTIELGKQPRDSRGSKAGTHGMDFESTENDTQKDQRLRIWQQKHFAVEDSTSQEGLWSSNPSDLQHPSFQATVKGPGSIDFGKDVQADGGHIV